MVRFAFPLMLALALLAPGRAAAQVMNDELKKLEGAWEAVELTMQGKKVPDEQLKQIGFTVSFKGNDLTLTRQGKDLKGEFKLDLKHKPKGIDIARQEGNEKKLGSWSKGLYELDGDTLKMCMHNRGGNAERPKEFKNDEEYGVMVLKRKKEKR